jgi:hypothetical protein
LRPNFVDLVKLGCFIGDVRGANLWLVQERVKVLNYCELGDSNAISFITTVFLVAALAIVKFTIILGKKGLLSSDKTTVP